MLTMAGGGGVRQLLKLADKGGRGGKANATNDITVFFLQTFIIHEDNVLEYTDKNYMVKG